LVPRQVTDTESALARLLGGNQRFGELVGRLQERTMGRGSDEPLVIPMCPVAWGLPLFKGQVLSQTPFAAILACSDARVPTETIFDQWFNDLFVLRLAGNVLGSECLGSLHYAIRNLADSLELVVVLGHSNCGAVQAAVSTYLSPTSFADIAYTYSLRSLIDQILIAVRGSAHALHEEGGSRIRTDARYPELLTAVVVYVNAAVSALELRRELSEELGWQPGPLTPVVALWVGGELIAWFYAAECDLAVTELRLEPGRSARWVGPRELAGTPLSPWHAATLHAWRSGEAVVSLPD